MPQRPFSAAVRVNASFWLLVLLAAIVSPLTVVAAILTAAALHELGHLAAMRYYGVSVKRFRLTALGAELDAPALARLSYGRELIITLAGVTVNLFCAILLALLGLRTWREWPFVFAGAHLVLAAFNLLPVVPLDGARALCLALSFFLGPTAGERVTAAVSLACSLALCALGLKLSLELHSGWLFAFAAFSGERCANWGLRAAQKACKIRSMSLDRKGACLWTNDWNASCPACRSRRAMWAASTTR